MKLAEMFLDQDTRTFEERRAEVVAIVRSAADFAGAENGLRALFQHICEAEDEQEFRRGLRCTHDFAQRERRTRYLQSV